MGLADMAMRYALHPRNTDFAWRHSEPPFRRLRDDEVRAYGDNGFIAVRDAFTPAELSEVIAAIDPLEAQTRGVSAQPRGRHAGDRARGRDHLLAAPRHAVGLTAFSQHPLLLDLCHDLIGANVRLYWDQSVYKKPDADKEFPWHQDNGYTYIEPQQYLTFWIALIDARSNGCPWVVPELHWLGTLEHRWTALGFQCLDDVEGAVPIESRPDRLRSSRV